MLKLFIVEKRYFSLLENLQRYAMRFNLRRKSFWKLACLLALFIIAVFVATNFERFPRAIPKAISLTEKTFRMVKFSLSPSVAVNVGNNTLTEPLKMIRSSSASGALRVNPDNPRYFTDGSGKAVYLTGAHTWANLQDNGLTYPPPAFNYKEYLDFLIANNHNFFRLWTWEEAKWYTDTPKDYWFEPIPYQRVGKELALDEKPKFDLTKFNQTYFDRLRQRVIEAGQNGIYVSVMLFNGWSIEDKGGPGNPWRGHPYHRDNNVNGIDGDPNKNERGEETHTLEIPAVTAVQEAYIRKVIDTVNDLDNVLYEISNESHNSSQDWQYQMISYIKKYEAGKPKQHPVGMTVEFPDGDNSKLFASPADWISRKGDIGNPPVADGKKVILADTDHLCGICGDRAWVWKSFTRGENPLFMDVYDGAMPLVEPPIPPNPLNYKPWVGIRRSLGYTLTYANRMNLVAMIPRRDLASTSTVYCLANSVTKGSEYLVYLPEGGSVTVDLSEAKGELAVEWLNPENGLVTTGITTTGGGNRTFIAPFDGDAVLYLKGKG
jgi:hypothetical protein